MNGRHHCHTCRAFWRLFHRRHGRKLAHVGKAGIFGEVSYHVAEIAGSHDALLVAAFALLVFSLARIASGEL